VGFRTEAEVIDPEKQFKKLSTNIAEQGFCQTCGSSFFFRYTNATERGGQEWLGILISLGRISLTIPASSPIIIFFTTAMQNGQRMLFTDGARLTRWSISNVMNRHPLTHV
jgi:hypothetical protein